MSKNWIILQLTEKGEMVLEEEPSVIENFLKKIIGNRYFLPLYYDKTKIYENKIFLFKGYVFVEHDTTLLSSINRLSHSPYFSGPLQTSKKIHLIPDEQIKKMKRQMTKMIRPIIKVGDRVKILDGKHKNLEATVSEYYKKEKAVDLIIELKCMNIIVPKIPIVNLQNLSRNERSKNSLQEKIIELLKEYPKGLTRKDIIDFLNLNETEKLRLSTCLSRAVQKNYLESKLNKNRNYLFLVKDNN